VLKVLLYTN